MCKCDGSCKSKITDEDIAEAVHTICDIYDDGYLSLSGVVHLASISLKVFGEPFNADRVNERVEKWLRNSIDFKVIETKNPYGVAIQVQRIKRG